LQVILKPVTIRLKDTLQINPNSKKLDTIYSELFTGTYVIKEFVRKQIMIKGIYNIPKYILLVDGKRILEFKKKNCAQQQVNAICGFHEFLLGKYKTNL